MYIGLYCYKMEQKIDCHKSLLNQFQDGLIVTEREQDKIIFANKKAKKFLWELLPIQLKESKDLGKIDLEKVNIDKVSTCNFLESISSMETESFSLGVLLK